MVIRDALIDGSNILKSSGIDSLDARVLLKFVLGFDDIALSINANSKISDEAYNKYMSFIKRRKENEPVAYITGQKEFMSLDFFVEPGILIPRPETEHIIEYVMEQNIQNANVLDICTGSGAIAVSVAYNLKDALVTAIDINDKCIDVAMKNAKKQGVDERCKVLKGDARESFDFDKQFDIVISNPPYIKSEDILHLQKDVKDYEPHLALDGGDDGLMFYRSISKNAHNILKDNGFIIYEIGYDQADDVCEILQKENYTDIKVIKDFAGMDRIVTATKTTFNGDNK